MSRHFAALVCVALFCAAMGSDTASADRSTGTWTGAVEVRGNYYFERSTRVVAPTVRLELNAPNGVSLSGEYLIDAITSASIAAGLAADIRFTEVRHDGALGVGYEFDLGDAQLLSTVRIRTSQEPDYSSYGITLSNTLSLNERATTLSLAITGLHDDVGRVLRGANRVGPDGRDLSNRGSVGAMDIVFMSLGLTQLLSPETFFELGYDFSFITGFQANPYRTVAVGGVARPEAHPSERVRNNVYGRLATYIPSTGTAIHLMARGYVDTWGIAAVTPEVRVYQEIVRDATVRARYRLYTQTRANFYEDPADYASSAVLITADPKMTEFHSHLIGLQLVLSLSALEGSALDFLSRATLDMSFDYIFNTNRFGDGTVALLGLRAPF